VHAVPFHVATLSAWRSEPDRPFTAASGVIPAVLASESLVLDVANAEFGGHFEPVVALVLDDQVVESAGAIDRSTVSEICFLRRDTSGRFVSLERRPPLADALDLYPHPEGGWYRETWASPVSIEPDGYGGVRASATAIYFLLPPGAESCWHKLRSDEIWLWQQGGVLELQLGGSGEKPDGLESFRLGPDVAAGEVLQLLVPAGVWQTARPAGGTEVLVSTVVSPGFHFDDFTTP
jgi:predicted cupin superfamily sugar epimerase